MRKNNIYNNANPIPNEKKNSKMENDNDMGNNTSKSNYNSINKDIFIELVKKIEEINVIGNNMNKDVKKDRKEQKFL